MFYDHEAVRKAYPEVVSIADNIGAFKEDGTEVTICLLYTSDAADE